MKVYIGKMPSGGPIIDTDAQVLKRANAQVLKTMTLAEYQAMGGRSSVVTIENGEAVFTLPEAVAKQKQVAELKTLLAQIDEDSGASRHVRDVSVSAGVVLDAVRVLLSRFAGELDIKLPAGFGSGAASAADILSLSPAPNATEKEKADFAVHKALLLVSHFDPAINPGLTIIKEAEMKAIPIREQLAPLLDEGEAG
ncbi:MAG: hypothetical protein LBH43_17960 [Treponema sp.]|jgi:hypothetical protein|nr:hypothetical protein [Treponema sp.]